MNQETFEKILQIWREAEEKSTRPMPPPKTDACLSFAQFEASEYTTAQREHIEQCVYCTRMNRLFTKHLGLRGEITMAPDEKEAIAKKRSLPVKILGKVKKLFADTVTGLGNILAPVPLPVRVAIPSAVVIAILIAILLSPSGKYADLARIEPVYYQPIVVRDAEKLFHKGMLLYQQEKYQLAIEKLSKVTELQPTEVNAHFYLGLCYLLTKKTDRAISHLQKVIELNGNFLLEKCYWYLGNAYLLKEDGKQALEMFQKVVEMEGDYEWEAREMIGEIENLIASNHQIR